MNFLNTLQLIATFNFAFVGIIILLGRRKVTYGVTLLAVFLIAKGVTLFTDLTYVMSWQIHEYIVLLLSSALFLYAPFLYFFARYLVHKTVLKPSRDFIHFLPFLCYGIYNLIEILYPFENIITSNIISVIYYLQTISYTIISFRLIHSKGDNSNNHYWLKYLLLSFLIVWFMFLGEMVAFTFNQYNTSEVFKTLGVISLLALANLTLVIAIYSPELFFKGLRIIQKTNNENRVITKSNYNYIVKVMTNENLYKNPNLKLMDLSNKLGLSERNTSLIIKTYYKGNFHEFLNSFRIDEAKRLFIEEQNALTISEVIYEVGFNSKSVFNTVFKKTVGMTPSQFKKSNTNISSVV